MLCACLRDIVTVAANNKAIVVGNFLVQARHLIQRHAQRHLRQVFAIQVNGRGDDADATGRDLGPKLLADDAGAMAPLVQIHQQVVVHVHDAVGVQMREARIQIGFRGGCHIHVWLKISDFRQNQ